MELNMFQSLFYGLISGITDIIPVSSQAHKTLLLTFFGAKEEPVFMRLMIHAAILAALYYGSMVQINRMLRQRRLARIPKRKRKRPVDTRSLMDYRLLLTAAIPIIIGYVFYLKVTFFYGKLIWISVFILINGVLLFVPAMLPSGNKDSRAMTPLEGVLIGFANTLSVFPGISSIGASTSAASLCGADRTYALNISLILHMVVTAALIIYDFLAIISAGLGAISIASLGAAIFAAIAAFIGAFLGIRLMRIMASNSGFHVFSLYCFGVALLTFILYLVI